MENVKNVTGKIKENWQNMDKKKKTTLVAVILALLIFIVIYAFTMGKSKYVVLFTDLDLEDAGNIVTDLDLNKVKYKLEDSGRTILIDEKKIDKYRIQLAMEGKIPESSSGFEIFDDVGLMVTDEDRKIMYQRALEGELQRSILSLDSIKAAKVHLVMSEKSVFETQEQPASASVILDIKSGHKVTDSMINGIAALVSGAVNNLPEENIQIIDAQGNLLSGHLLSGGSSSIDMVNKNQGIKEAFERDLETNLINLLGDIFGRDKVRVVVNADLDFDAQESTIIKYSNPQIRSEHLNVAGDDIDVMPEDSLIGDNASNVIGRVRGEGSIYNRTVNNELDTETTTVIKAPGKVNKLTASVVYDGQLSDLKAEQIENIVATAIGYDFEREDLISVVGIEFDRPEEEIIDETGTGGFGEFLNNNRNMVIGIILAALIVAIIITIIRRVLSRRRDGISDEMLIEEIQPTQQMDIEALTRQAEELAAAKKLKDLAREEVAEDGNKAKNYAKDNPDLAADLIKAWLKEEDR